jgi:hypothetical protein
MKLTKQILFRFLVLVRVKIMNLDLFKRKYSFQKLIIFGVVFILFIYIGLTFHNGSNGSDFKTWYEVGNAAKEKMNIYARFTTGHVFYLPFFSIFMIPFTFFSFENASFLFVYLNILFVSIFFLSIFKDFKENIYTKSKKIIAVVLIAFLCLNFLITNFRCGETNIIVLFCIYCGIKFYYERKFSLSAFFLVLSAFKIVPLIFFFFVLF